MDGQFFSIVGEDFSYDFHEFADVMDEYPNTIHLVEQDEQFYDIYDHPSIFSVHQNESVELDCDDPELTIYHNKDCFKVIIESGKAEATGWKVFVEESEYRSTPLGSVPKGWIKQSPFGDECVFRGQIKDIQEESSQEVLDTVIRECII